MLTVRGITYAAVAGAALLGAGCGYRHGDLARSGTLRIELSPPSGPVFYGVSVDQHGGEFVVTGFGKRPSRYGEIEVQIVRPAGEVLGRKKAKILKPLPVPNRSYNYRFRAVLPLVPPDGSVIRVLYHEFGRETDPGDADNGGTSKLLTYSGFADLIS